MPLCRYFLRGFCRFGNECRFEHSTSQQPRGFDSPGPRRPFSHGHQPSGPRFHHPPPSYQHRPSDNSNRHSTEQSRSKNNAIIAWIQSNFTDKDKAIDILKQLQNEAKPWLKGHHFWRFTSRSLFPGGRPLECWTDQSFEEVRWIYFQMSQADQAHIYKKEYSKYWEQTERQLYQTAQLDLATLESLKVYIDEYLKSSHQPSTVSSADVEMLDMHAINPINSFTSMQMRNPFDVTSQHIAESSVNDNDDTFEFGDIPAYVPVVRNV